MRRARRARPILRAFGDESLHEAGSALQVVHGDVLVDGIEGGHAHAQRDGTHPAGGEHVGIGAAAGAMEPRLEAGHSGSADDGLHEFVLLVEQHGVVALRPLDAHRASEARGGGLQRLGHGRFLSLGALGVQQRAALPRQRARVRHDVRRAAALDEPDVRLVASSSRPSGMDETAAAAMAMADTPFGAHAACAARPRTSR